MNVTEDIRNPAIRLSTSEKYNLQTKYDVINETGVISDLAK